MKESKNILLLLLIIILLGIAMLVFSDYMKNSKMETISNFKGYEVLPKKLNLNQEFALRTWRDILNVRVSEKDERLEKIKAKEIIRLYIEVLAARIKIGKKDFKDVLVSNKDIKKALSLLNETSPIIADRFVGNWDDYCSVPEINKLINYPETSFQISVITEMTRTYYQF